VDAHILAGAVELRESGMSSSGVRWTASNDSEHGGYIAPSVPPGRVRSVDAERILDGLNPEQRRAVQAVRGPVCILAGAGTGKTTTITRRIAYQVATRAFAPGQLLAVTFTDKAAGEMRSRLAGLGVQGVEARTFHSAALAQLSRFGASPPQQILSSKALALRQIGNTLPRPYRFRPAADLATEVEWAKNRRVRPDRYPQELGDHEPPIPADLMSGVYRRYEQGKERRGMVDFEDLLELAIRLFEDDAIAERFRARTLAITVDEYQDANLLQQTLLERWLGIGDDLCVVGDDYQSIYGFTGATPQYLLGMPARFPGCAVIRLEENHRSTPEILEVANRLVPRLGGVGKVLRPTRQEGPKPELRGFPHPDDEAGWLVARIRELRATAGLPLEGMAVLSRVNSRSEDFEEALSRARIPFQVRGGAFLSRPAARAILRRLRDGSATGVAALVRAAASAEGMAPGDIPEDLGEQETVRQNDLARLVRLAEEFEGRDGSTGGTDGTDGTDGTVRAFVEDLRARFASDGDGRGVNLLTFHRAKGLEFDAVFLPRLQEGELPFRRSKSDEAIGEERRLLYVGITRARRYLAVSWVADGRSRPSRFVSELRGAHDTFGKTSTNVAPGRVARGEDSRARAPVELAAGSEAAFAALRTWRLERARADAVPPYVVFHDRTLAEIARVHPSGRAGLAAIGGVGPAKLERYADQVLAVLRAAGAATEDAVLTTIPD
jgi:DNA helicase-2/ATP-dependent DNA helicase PcrA